MSVEMHAECQRVVMGQEVLIRGVLPFEDGEMDFSAARLAEYPQQAEQTLLLLLCIR